MQTDYAINPQYQAAVQAFKWEYLEEDKEDYQPDVKNIETLVNLVAQSIIQASEHKEALSGEAGKPLSLIETCYILTQQTDHKTGNSTPAKVENLQFKDRKFIHLTFDKLKAMFVQIKEEDLKEATLLFSVNRLQDVVLSKLKQMEQQLSQLKAIQTQFEGVDRGILPQIQKDLLDKCDMMIPIFESEVRKAKMAEKEKVYLMTGLDKKQVYLLIQELKSQASDEVKKDGTTLEQTRAYLELQSLLEDTPLYHTDTDAAYAIMGKKPEVIKLFAEKFATANN